MLEEKIDEKTQTIDKSSKKERKSIIFIIMFLVAFSLLITGVVLMLFDSQKEYLSEKYQKILLQEIKDYKKSLIIDSLENNKTNKYNSKKFVKNKEYENCNGNIDITRIDRRLKIDISFQCKKEEKRNITHIYGYFDKEQYISTSFIVGEEILLVLEKDVVRNDKGKLENNIQFILLDKRGNLKWEKSYDKEKKSKNVIDAKRIGDNIYIFVETEQLTEEHSIEDQATILLEYNLDGKLMKEQSLPFPAVRLQYLGTSNNDYYYIADNWEPSITHNILVLKKDGSIDYPYAVNEEDEEQYYEWNDEQGIYEFNWDRKEADDEAKMAAVEPYQMNFTNGAILNNNSLYAIYENDETSKITLSTGNLKGEKTKIVDVDNLDTYANIGDLLIVNEYVFAQLEKQEENGDYRSQIFLKRFNKELEEVNPKYDLNKDILTDFENKYGKDIPDGFYPFEITSDGNYLRFEINGNENNDSYLYVLNEELEIIRSLKINGDEFPSAYVGKIFIMEDNTVCIQREGIGGEYVLSFYQEEQK